MRARRRSNFVATRSLLEAIASSLTEMFSPETIRERVSGMLTHYAFVSPSTLRYFEYRTSEAPRDVDFALAYVRRNANTAEKQNAVCAALKFKCAMLWAQLDAIHYAYVLAEPPPGAWRPGEGIARAEMGRV